MECAACGSKKTVGVYLTEKWTKRKTEPTCGVIAIFLCKKDLETYAKEDGKDPNEIRGEGG